MNARNEKGAKNDLHSTSEVNTGTDLAKLLDWNAGATPNVREVWTHKQFALLFNNHILHEGTLFAFNEKRRGHTEFTALDATTGEARRAESDASFAALTGKCYATPTLANGLLYLRNNAGEIAAYDLRPANPARAKPVASSSPSAKIRPSAVPIPGFGIIDLGGWRAAHPRLGSGSP